VCITGVQGKSLTGLFLDGYSSRSNTITGPEIRRLQNLNYFEMREFSLWTSVWVSSRSKIYIFANSTLYLHFPNIMIKNKGEFLGLKKNIYIHNRYDV